MEGSYGRVGKLMYNSFDGEMKIMIINAQL